MRQGRPRQQPERVFLTEEPRSPGECLRTRESEALAGRRHENHPTFQAELKGWRRHRHKCSTVCAVGLQYYSTPTSLC